MLTMVKFVWVDKEACIGCGVCVAIAPDYFQMEDDGKSVAIHNGEKGRVKVEEQDEENVMTAVHSCPTNAIKVDEE